MPGHITRNYKLKNKVQQLQFNILTIGPSLNDSDNKNILMPDNNLKRSVRNLSQPQKADSLKKKKHLEYFKGVHLTPQIQQVLYWIWKNC